MKTQLLTAALLLLALPGPSAPAAARPLRDFCKSVWLFSWPCNQVSTVILRQIQTFSPEFGCDKCGYRLVAGSPSSLTANHTSADLLQAEVIELTFTSSTSASVAPEHCRMKAKSASIRPSLETSGVNYCNTYDLLAASGLLSSPGVFEMTNLFACRGYSVATCRAA